MIFYISGVNIGLSQGHSRRVSLQIIFIYSLTNIKLKLSARIPFFWCVFAPVVRHKIYWTVASVPDRIISPYYLKAKVQTMKAYSPEINLACSCWLRGINIPLYCYFQLASFNVSRAGVFRLEIIDLSFAIKTTQANNPQIAKAIRGGLSKNNYYSMQMFLPLHWPRAHQVTCK